MSRRSTIALRSSWVISAFISTTITLRSSLTRIRPMSTRSITASRSSLATISSRSRRPMRAWMSTRASTRLEVDAVRGRPRCRRAEDLESTRRAAAAGRPARGRLEVERSRTAWMSTRSSTSSMSSAPTTPGTTSLATDCRSAPASPSSVLITPRRGGGGGGGGIGVRAIDVRLPGPVARCCRSAGRTPPRGTPGTRRVALIAPGSRAMPRSRSPPLPSAVMLTRRPARGPNG